MPRERARLEHLRDVILLLVCRDFKGRYKHTHIGMAWSVASPLMFLAMFYFLFTRVINLAIPRYASFVFIGILAWTWTQSALTRAVTCISENAGLVNQPGFPVGALPIVAVSSTFLNLLIALPLLFGLLFFEGAHFSVAVVLLPVLVAAQFILILGVAYVVAALNVGLRDVEQMLPIILQLGYYATPIFFDASRIPPSFSPLFQANPMAHIIDAYRTVLMDGKFPDFGALLAIATAGVGLLILGRRYFEQARFRFLEELG